jgi:hypothetical protein
MAGVGESLCTAFDGVWARFTGRLEGLDDAEYLWEPVDGCWSIREGADRRWRMDGVGAGVPAPARPPVTTIAWRIGHLSGIALGAFANWLFGDSSLTVEDISFPGRAAEVPDFCGRNYRAWRDGIGSIDQERWWQPLGPKWHPYAEASTWTSHCMCLTRSSTTAPRSACCETSTFAATSFSSARRLDAPPRSRWRDSAW